MNALSNSGGMRGRGDLPSREQGVASGGTEKPADEHAVAPSEGATTSSVDESVAGPAGVGERAGEGRLYAKMPQLSDRCGGSRDDSVMIPVPDGMELPEGVVVIRLDDEPA